MVFAGNHICHGGTDWYLGLSLAERLVPLLAEIAELQSAEIERLDLVVPNLARNLFRLRDTAESRLAWMHQIGLLVCQDNRQAHLV